MKSTYLSFFINIVSHRVLENTGNVRMVTGLGKEDCISEFIL